MDKGQKPSIVEQLFDAIDEKNYTTARFALCAALDKAGRDAAHAATQQRAHAAQLEAQA